MRDAAAPRQNAIPLVRLDRHIAARHCPIPQDLASPQLRTKTEMEAKVKAKKFAASPQLRAEAEISTMDMTAAATMIAGNLQALMMMIATNLSRWSWAPLGA